MIQVVFIEIIEKVRELADGYNADSGKAQEEDYEKLDRNPAFHGSLWTQKQRQAEARLLYELTGIKAKEEGY